MNKVVAIVQARASSTRFPGKVLLDLDGRPVFLQILDKLKQCQHVDSVVLATSEEASDNPLALIAKEHEYAVVRGPLLDVLSRFELVARKYAASNYVRITADCPLLDPGLVDDLIKEHCRLKVDYSSNALEPTLPDGFDSEIMRYETLIEAAEKASSKLDREHVTRYIYMNPDRFRIHSHKHGVDLSSYRLTLDTPEDWRLIQSLCEMIDKDLQDIRLDDVVCCLQRNPHLAEINAMHRRSNWQDEYPE